MRRAFFLALLTCLVLPLHAQKQRDAAAKADKEWIPTGVWPFLNRRFESAEVVTGFITPKKTIVPCNIHIGKQTLMYVQNDTLMEADAGNVSRVTFKNGDVYIPIGHNVFGKIVHEDSVGKVVRVRLVDKKEFDKNAKDTRHLGSFNLGGDFGELNIDFISTYDAKPEEKPLPILDTYFFIHKLKIFEVTDKNVLENINPTRRKEYRVFTRSAEILSHNQSSVMKIWEQFFVKW